MSRFWKESKQPFQSSTFTAYKKRKKKRKKIIKNETIVKLCHLSFLREITIKLYYSSIRPTLD